MKLIKSVFTLLMIFGTLSCTTSRGDSTSEVHSSRWSRASSSKWSRASSSKENPPQVDPSPDKQSEQTKPPEESDDSEITGDVEDDSEPPPSNGDFWVLNPNGTKSYGDRPQNVCTSFWKMKSKHEILCGPFPVFSL